MLIGQLTYYEQYSVRGKPVLSYASEPVIGRYAVY